MTGTVLLLDSGSPLVSVAVGRSGAVLAARSAEIARSSARLLAMVDATPREPGPLAAAALPLLPPPGDPAWDPALLTAPIYARPPAVTAPRPAAAARGER